MKKLLLLTLAAGMGFGAMAQNVTLGGEFKNPLATSNMKAAKTTAVLHDSLFMTNLGPTDTSLYFYRYSGDTGFTSGTNAMGRWAYAERYTFNAADSAVKVIGIGAFFIGKVNSASTKTITVKVWDAASKTATSRSTLYFSGVPTTGLDSVTNIPYTSLGITDTSTSFKRWYFTTPTAYLTDTFFVGYSTNYSWSSMNGDTIGVATTLNGNRVSPVINVVGTDTTVNNQNCVLTASNVWFDNGYNYGLKYNYWIFPIVNTRVFVGVKGITRNDFTFFGNYPNPAVNSTNIKFALANSTDVTIQVMDINGRAVKTLENTNMAAGEHTISLDVATLPAGQYVYVIRTAEGDGIASQLTVIK